MSIITGIDIHDLYGIDLVKKVLLGISAICIHHARIKPDA